MWDCLRVVLEGSPDEVDIDLLWHDLLAVQNVINVHDLHVWQLSMGKWALSAHVRCKIDSDDVLKKCLHIVRVQYKVLHATI